ncbi:hypothetical protein L914_11852 [Phytophthora nicotianae]|uniref:Uncharacterized protein n=1 Tax=Phytophthora nicotianae TaxID=4792 RepID=W2N1P4_PHYNI|nr:hypothetical protein L914_11852 [Phytophthora nicotianae]
MAAAAAAADTKPLGGKCPLTTTRLRSHGRESDLDWRNARKLGGFIRAVWGRLASAPGAKGAKATNG